MFYFFFLLAIALLLALIFSVIKSGRFYTAIKVYRILIVIFATGVFTYLFVEKSLDPYRADSLTVQVINKLPFPLDFYIIKINNTPDENLKFITKHLGKIRDNYYRIEHLEMDISDQFWVAGYMGNKNLVYFSQHAVPNKNEDQIIEVHNYMIQSSKLAEIAKGRIDDLKFNNVKTAIWITLNLLLLFLNFGLLLRKSKEETPTALAGISKVVFK